MQNFWPDVRQIVRGIVRWMSAGLSAGCLPNATVRKISAKWNLPCAQWAGHFFTTARKNTGRLLNLKSMWMDNQYDQPMTFLNIKRGSDRGVRSFIYYFFLMHKVLIHFLIL